MHSKEEVCMRLGSAMIASTILLFALLRAHPLLASGTVDREIVAMIAPEVLQLPVGTDSSTVEQATISSIVLENQFATLGVEMITRAVPDFSLSDTLFVTPEGDSLRITNWANVYVLRLPVGSSPEEAAATLAGMAGVSYAEPNGTVVFEGHTYPKDEHFVDGGQWSLWSYGQSGAVDADIDGPEAWGIEQGSTSIKIGVIDAGVLDTHEDLSGRVEGRVSGQDFGIDRDGHGSKVAGIIGARPNNDKGIAGINWNSMLVSRNIFGKGDTDIAAYIRDAWGAGASILNYSWRLTERDETTARYSTTIRLAINDLYKFGSTSVAAMGNQNTSVTQYPAGFGQGVIAVGATNSGDTRWIDASGGSNTGSHIDVAAPGAGVLTTGYGATDQYVSVTGTSFAVPHVVGMLSLLKSEQPSLDHDDMEAIIRLSSDNKGPEGWDDQYGWGRANALRALQLIRAPNELRGPVSVFGKGQLVGTPVSMTMRFKPGSGLRDTLYSVKRREIRQTVHFTPGFVSAPQVWGLGRHSTGFSPENFNYGLGWCEPVPGTITRDSCKVRTYVYEVFHDQFGNPGQEGAPGINGVLYPTGSNPINGFYQVWVAVRPLGVAAIPDTMTSYYVPQSGQAPNIKDGTSLVPAFRFFRTCPNNDLNVISLEPRVKVVVKDAANNGIAGISAADIFILLNGGTQAQEFVGEGADSMIANSEYNPSPLCPDLRAINANADTDATGTTFISFFGAGATRNSNRKWGHYDSELPIFVLARRLKGRLSDASTHGSYSLQIKNLDYLGGLGTGLNQGAAVSSADYNNFVDHLNEPVSADALNWWRDFDSDGYVGSSDFNIMTTNPGHTGHDCDTPSNP
jgi:hypothetical protein